LVTLSLDTAYRSFGGEVEASSTPTICRPPDSRRHQFSAIARCPGLSALATRPLDDDTCMEVTALKDQAETCRHFADRIIAERGVRYGRVATIPTSAKTKRRPKAYLAIETPVETGQHRTPVGTDRESRRHRLCSEFATGSPMTRM